MCTILYNKIVLDLLKRKEFSAIQTFFCEQGLTFSKSVF